MKSLILKDLYNIGHNAKTMVFLLTVLAIALVPNSGYLGFTATSAIMCSMMVITTFSFDDMSKWTKYAMIMPVTKNELVLSKYLVLGIFSVVGVLFGACLSVIMGIFLDSLDIKNILFTMVIGLAFAIIMGSLSIPLLFKFGAEQARLMTILSFAVPVIIGYGIYKIGASLNISISDHVLKTLGYLSPVVLVIFIWLSIIISCKIFNKKELQS